MMSLLKNVRLNQKVPTSTPSSFSRPNLLNRHYSTEVGVKNANKPKQPVQGERTTQPATQQQHQSMQHRGQGRHNRHLSPFQSNFFEHPFGKLLQPEFPFRSPFFSNFDRAFKDLENPMFSEAETQLGNVKVNLYSTKDGWNIEAELAGIPKEDVQVEIEDNVITIKGEKKIKQEEEDNRVYSRKETFYGSFSRSFELPDAADTSNVKANFQDGVLKIKIGKKEGAAEKVQKIAIE